MTGANLIEAREILPYHATDEIPLSLLPENPFGPLPKPIACLINNRQSITTPDNIPLHTPPSGDGHYDHKWLWDGVEHAKVFARYGYLRYAVQEFWELIKEVDDNGFLANMTFAPGSNGQFPERYTFSEPKRRSNYSQPPILAEGALEIYENMLANGELETADTIIKLFYPNLKRFYEYFSNNRRVSTNNPLIFNIHPCETGRDNDIIFDHHKARLGSIFGKNRMVGIANATLDYASNIRIGFENKFLLDWDPKDAHKVFKFCDPMFNCMFVKNQRDLAKLARVAGDDEYADLLTKQANELSRFIQDNMFKHFYPDSPEKVLMPIDYTGIDPNIDPDSPGNTVREMSVSSLFGLQLEDLDTEKLQATIDLFEKHFDAPYGVPTVAISSSKFDPSYKEPSMWRGPSWMFTNDFLEEAFYAQYVRLSELHPELAKKCLDYSQSIRFSSKILVSGELDHESGKPGIFKRLARIAIYKVMPDYISRNRKNIGPFGCYAEFFDPITGNGFRTTPFSTSTIGERNRLWHLH